MSKHSTADEKLGVSPSVRPKSAPAGRQPEPKDNAAPQVPSKGTNSNNQYR